MRPIDADALIHHFYETEYASMYYVEVVKRIIDAQPTLSPDEARGVGKWIEKEVYNLEYTTIEQMQSACCSVCGKYHTTPYSYYFSKYNYCPSCGARLGNGGTDDS
jgi:hypothetical protein